MKLPIYHNKIRCYLCNEEIEIHHPDDLAFEFGVGNINKEYSAHRGREIIGNICTSCGALQTDISSKAFLLKHIYDEDFQDRIIWVDKKVFCNHCGKLIEDDTIPNGWELHKRINRIFVCKECRSNPPKE